MSVTSKLINRRKEKHSAGTEAIISEWCDIIANDVAERRFFDKKEVAAYAKIKLATAIDECLKIQNDDLIKYRLKLVSEYTSSGITYAKKMKLASELAELNIKIKERNKAIDGVQDVFLKDIDGIKVEKKWDELKEKANRFLIGRIHKIEPIQEYSLKPIQNFILCLGFNRKNPWVNESNCIECQLQKDKCGIINDFKVGDIVVVQYNIIGRTINTSKGVVYAHTINVSRIKKED